MSTRKEGGVSYRCPVHQDQMLIDVIEDDGRITHGCLRCEPTLELVNVPRALYSRAKAGGA